MELKIFYEETDETKNILGKLLEDKFIKEAILADRHNRRVILLKIDGEEYVLKREKTFNFFGLNNNIRLMHNNIKALNSKGFFNTYNVKFIIEKKIDFFHSELIYMTNFVRGESPKTKEDYDEMMKLLVKLHSLKHYHGDCKPENFIKTCKGMVMIDSKFRRAFFNKLGIYKDVLRLQRFTKESLDLDKYFKNYKKHILYYVAILLIYRRDIFRGNKSFWKEVL